jgi:hypothetical protein
VIAEKMPGVVYLCVVICGLSLRLSGVQSFGRNDLNCFRHEIHLCAGRHTKKEEQEEHENGKRI